MNTVIEVGANDGRDTQHFLSNKDNNVYCFEPTVELQLVLQKKFKNFENFHLIPAAVHIENGFQWFNIAGSSDWGCSSLYDFADDLDKTWAGRTDFHVTDRYKVMTMRLDTFIDLYDIKEIDYLWIDAQGNDFKVLQSLGDKLSRVREGKCEAAFEVELYKTKENNAYEIKDWLEKRNFECVFRGGPHEVDVHFRRK